jgi:hypothetical protein
MHHGGCASESMAESKSGSHDVRGGLLRRFARKLRQGKRLLASTLHAVHEEEHSVEVPFMRRRGSQGPPSSRTSSEVSGAAQDALPAPNFND